MVKQIKIKKGKRKLIPWLGRFSPVTEGYEVFYQKSLGGLFEWKFSPADYTGKSIKQKRKLAYENARNHSDFYKDLVKQGVYPKGTKIKVKRKKHSDAFIVQFWMPEINTLNPRQYKVNDPIWHRISEIIKVMKQTAEKHGYSPRARFSEDVDTLRNYGLDKEGNLRYVDTDILDDFLPSTKRKPSRSEKNLEERVNIFVLLFFGGIILSLFSLTVTGNAISNLTETSQGLLGLILFVIGLAGLFFSSKH